MRMAMCLALLLALRSPVRGQCKADFNGNGRTEVSEVLTAVNEVLNGCAGDVPTPTATRGNPPPTPTRTPTEPANTCPYRFNQTVTADRFCGYFGSAHNTCNVTFQIASGWTTSGSAVIAVIADSSGAIGVYGKRTNPTTAAVDSVANGPNFDQPVHATGSLTLPSATVFGLTFSTSATCGNLVHSGTFTGLLGNDTVASSGEVSVTDLRHLLTQDAEAPAQSAATDDDGAAQMRALLQALRAR